MIFSMPLELFPPLSPSISAFRKGRREREREGGKKAKGPSGVDSVLCFFAFFVFFFRVFFSSFLSTSKERKKLTSVPTWPSRSLFLSSPCVFLFQDMKKKMYQRDRSAVGRF